jgi:O-antigen/teichoic acid export membrane protein
MVAEISENNIAISLRPLNIFRKAYRFVFREEVSTEMLAFVKNLLFVGTGTAISALISMAFNITGGRQLGPEEYGKFALIQSVAMFLYIPMLMGFHISMLKYTSEKLGTKRQADIVTSSYLLVAALIIIFTLIYLILMPFLISIFGIEPELYYLAIAFAVVFTFFTLTTSALRGLNRMRLFSIFQIAYSLLLISIFVVFLFSQGLSYKAMVFAMLISLAVITAIIIGVSIRRYILGRVKLAIAKILARYAIYLVVGCFSFEVYSNVDRIIIGRFLNIGDVGVYSAYYAASINVAFLFSGIFSMVFFPTVTRYKNKEQIYKKINKLMPYIIGLGIPGLAIAQFVILKLYGSQYEINLIWMILFALTGMSLIVQGIYAWLLNSVGSAGARISSITALIAAVLNIFINVILVANFGLVGAILSLLITYLAAIAIILKMGRPYFVKNGNNGLPLSS